jgi:hypothetical protein
MKVKLSFDLDPCIYPTAPGAKYKEPTFFTQENINKRLSLKESIDWKCECTVFDLPYDIKEGMSFYMKSFAPYFQFTEEEMEFINDTTCGRFTVVGFSDMTPGFLLYDCLDIDAPDA